MTGLLGRLRPAHPARTSGPATRLRDIVVATCLALVDLTLVSGALVSGEPVTSVVYDLAGFVPLVWRRQAPIVVFVAVWVHLLGALVLTPGSVPLLALLAALYTVAAQRSSSISVAALGAGYVLYAPAATQFELRTEVSTAGLGATVGLMTFFGLFFGAVWGLGRWVRHSRSQVESLELQRSRAADEAVSAERRRLARELHDIVSHSVSVMVLQAAGARRVLDREPARAGEALQQIESVGKQSMSELRRLLGVLRDGQLIEGDIQGPQPGLADVPSLIDGFRLSGLSVLSEATGRPRPLDGSVDLAVFRIVQEALTNAAKHTAAGTVVTVRQVWAADLLLIEVTDDGTARPDEGLSTGHGLLGLRERARAVGGQFEAGPVPGGGFRVRATVPVSPGAGSRDVREKAKGLHS